MKSSRVYKSGADPENVEPGGANNINYQTEPGGANLFFGLTYKGEQGGVRRVRPPLNPRLHVLFDTSTSTQYSISTKRCTPSKNENLQK